MVTFKEGWNFKGAEIWGAGWKVTGKKSSGKSRQQITKDLKCNSK